MKGYVTVRLSTADKNKLLEFDCVEGDALMDLSGVSEDGAITIDNELAGFLGNFRWKHAEAHKEE